jgi:glycosyltransferase involved in cell wall biosynthesis
VSYSPQKLHKLNILIIAHAFPPMNSTASHRPYSWVKTWQKMGHNVCVLTNRKYPFDGSMDLNYDLSGIQLYVVDYLKIKKYKKSADRPFGKDTVSSWEKLKTITRRLRFGLGMFADLRMLSLLPLIKKGTEIIKEHRIDLLVSTYPPEVVHLAASWLSEKHNIPWAADYRDLWFREGRLYQFRTTTAIGDILNRKILRKARVVSTVSKGLGDKLRGIISKDVIVSYNGYIRLPNRTKATDPWNDQKKHLVYTGRLYPKKRDPEMLLQALTILRESNPGLIDKISIDFYGHEDPYLIKLIQQYGVSSWVNTHPFVPYQESVALQKSAAALIFLDWLETDVEGVLTGKLFEYLISGRPIVCVGNRKNTEAASIIRECQYGVILTTVTEMANYLNDLAKNDVTVSPDWDRVQFYSREHQSTILVDAMTGILHGP